MKVEDATLLVALLVACATTHVSCNSGYLYGATTVNSDEDVQIVGGDDVDIKVVPYQVSLLANNVSRCGGCIISQDIILTAAHCVKGYIARQLQIRAGSSSNKEGGQVVQVKTFIMNPEYSQASEFDSDIAIMWLSKPLQFDDSVKAVPMINGGEEIPAGKTTTVSGWGRIKYGGDRPKTLQMVKVPVVSWKDCNATYVENTQHWSEELKPPPITQNMMCTGFPEGGKNACHGDSGGPLVNNGKLAGIVSWGIFCADARFPGVYAKVSALRPWIDKTIANFKNNETV